MKWKAGQNNSFNYIVRHFGIDGHRVGIAPNLILRVKSHLFKQNIKKIHSQIAPKIMSYSTYNQIFLFVGLKRGKQRGLMYIPGTPLLSPRRDDGESKQSPQRFLIKAWSGQILPACKCFFVFFKAALFCSSNEHNSS